MTAEAIRRILVVDDEDFIRDLCLQILSLEDYNIETAVNGDDALIKIKNAVYDLIISDMEMPVLDGINLYLRVEKDYPYLKNRFLFMTGDIEVEKEAQKILSRTGNMVLPKPFRPNELLNHVRILTGIPIEASLKQIGLNRRKEERFAKTADCKIFTEESYASASFTAQVQDISENGIKVKYSGVPSLNKGSRISVKMKDIRMRRNAEVVWTRDLKWFSLCGMKLTESLPVSSIVTLGRTP